MKILVFLFSLSVLLIRGCDPPENYNDPASFVQLSITDTLVIACDRDTFIQGSEGTMVFIPAHAFMTADSLPATGSIEILLDEYYQLDEMLVQKLATTNENQKLISGGLINLSAQSNQGELLLVEGAKIVLHFPKIREVEKHMNLYNGNRIPDGNMSWSVDSSSLQQPKAFLYEYGIRWAQLNKHGVSPFYFADDAQTDLYSYFLQHFDQTQLKYYEDQVGNHMRADFNLDLEGKISELEIYAMTWNTSQGDSIAEELVNVPCFKDFVSNLPPLTPARNEKGIAVDAEASLFFAIDWERSEFLDNEAYLIAFEQKFGDDGEAMNAGNKGTHYYMMATSKLGWISCNANWEIPQDQQTTITVESNRNPFGSVYLVYSDLNCIIPGLQRNGKIYFSGVPKNKKGTLVALGSDGKTALAGITEIWDGDEKTIKLDINPIRYPELRELLKNINRKPNNPPNSIPTT